MLEINTKLYEATGLTLKDLEGFCRVMYCEENKKSKNPLPTIRALLQASGLDIPVSFNPTEPTTGIIVYKTSAGVHLQIKGE